MVTLIFFSSSSFFFFVKYKGLVIDDFPREKCVPLRGPGNDLPFIFPAEVTSDVVASYFGSCEYKQSL